MSYSPRIDKLLYILVTFSNSLCIDQLLSRTRRLSQEGLASIVPFVGAKRRVRILKEDLILVLQNDNPSKPPELHRFTEHTQQLVKDLGNLNK